MVTRLRVTIRGKNYDIVGGSKADVARALFEAPEGYSVSEVSKAIPMAYSQAHSIARREGILTYPGEGKVKTKPKASREDSMIRAHGMKPADADRRLGRDPASDTEGEVYRHDNNARRRATARAVVGAAVARYDKSRPAAKAIVWKGVCANCGHDIEARMVGRQNTFVHVHVTPEEFLKTIQFCMAFPRGMA